MSSVGKISEARKSSYKTRGMTSDELRRRREEASIEIRKNKREDSLNKKRSITLQPSLEENEVEGPISQTSGDANKDYPALVQGIYDQNLEVQLQNVVAFRKILSRERNPPIDDVVRLNIVPRFVEIVAGYPNVPPELQPIMEKLQFEASWVLTNIASGTSDQTKVVIQAGAVPVFINLMGHHSVELREQAVWALGNISGDSPLCRDFTLQNGLLENLLLLIEKELQAGNSKLSLLRNATWTLSNLVRGKPAPDWNRLIKALPAILALVRFHDDEVISDACWALAYISDGPADKLDQVIGSGILPYIVSLLGHRNFTVVSPAVRVLGNVVTGDDRQTQSVIDAGALPAFKSLVRNSKTSIQKEVCWTISNITAGTVDQIQAVLDAGLIPSLIYSLQQADFKVKKEACWALSKATFGKNVRPDQVRFIAAAGAIKPLCDILGYQDNQVTIVALDALANILEVGEMDSVHHDGHNPYAIALEEANGVDKIYELQNHQNEDIYLKAKNILERFLNFEEDEETGVDASSTSFQFLNAAEVPQGGFQF